MEKSSRILSGAIIGGVAIGVTIIACGNGGTHVTVTDAKVFKDAPGSGSQVTCSVQMSYSPSSFSSQQAISHTGSGAQAFANTGHTLTNVLVWNGVLSTTPEVDVRWFAFSGDGSGTPDWPTGNVTAKSGLDQASNMDTEVLLLGNLGSDNFFHDIYLAEAGILNITAVGSNTTSTGSGLMFVHIDPNTFQPIDSCTSTITSFSGNAPTMNTTMRTSDPMGDIAPEWRNVLHNRFAQ